MKNTCFIVNIEIVIILIDESDHVSQAVLHSDMSRLQYSGLDRNGRAWCWSI
jgi:hypothetical protein